MDADSFDRLTRSLPTRRLAAAPHSRRSLVAALGALGLLGATEAETKRKRKNNGKKKRGQKPPRNPCLGQPNDSFCNGDGRCLNGVCHPLPQCAGYRGACSLDSHCCSGDCGGAECREGELGRPCYFGRDCGSGNCVGYRCVPDFCPVDADFCDSGAPRCSGFGACLRPVGGGPSRCGRHDGSQDGSMCNCASDQDCVTRTGISGAFCALVSGDHCTCPIPGQPDGSTFCVLPV